MSTDRNITRAQDITAPAYVVPDGLEHLADALRASYEDGATAARNVATWTTDGNGDVATYARMLQGLEDGDPAVLDSLPTPNLSGEQADGPTPSSLAADHLPDDIDGQDGAYGSESLESVADVLTTAWEAGVDAVYMQAVEAELRAVVPVELHPSDD